jgi:phage-related protein
MVTVLDACRREIAALSDEIRSDLADAIARLEIGLRLSMPLSRPMPNIGRSAHELRLRYRSGTYRVVYVLGGNGEVILVHAFRKTTRATQLRSVRAAQKRLKEMGR